MSERHADMRHILSQVRLLTGGMVAESLRSSVDLSGASEDQLKKIASEFDDPEGGEWSFEPAFPIHEYIHDSGERAQWFERTLEDEDDPESHAHLQALTTTPSFPPIVLWITEEGDVYVWDGNHRLGAACARGENTIPAIVGRAGMIEEATMTRASLNKGLPAILPATPANIEAAKQFVMKKWVERFNERYPFFAKDPDCPHRPKDLSSSCKFTSLFAQGVFGGTLRGNEGHQYVELPNGERLDLNADAQDVLDMGALHQATGKTGWHNIEGRENEGLHFHGDPHAHDPSFFGSRDHLDSMRTVVPRVQDWIREFVGQQR